MAGEPTFNPNPKPDPGAEGEVNPRILIAQFGDGYSQRSQDGLNALNERWPLRWTNLTKAEMEPIIAFFEARGGYEAFFWTPPWETTPKKWVCRAWRKVPKHFEIFDIAATLDRVYDL